VGSEEDMSLILSWKAFVLLASTASFLQPIKKSNENMLRKRKRFIK
jgi:hypothetical protein